MRKLPALVAAFALATSFASAPAVAQSRGAPGAGEMGGEQMRGRPQAPGNQARGDQESARAEMRAGRNMPIRDIEQRIIPRMEQGDEYIGFEYDSTVQAYRLKFIRSGRMIWVDVDAQTARVLRISR